MERQKSQKDEEMESGGFAEKVSSVLSERPAQKLQDLQFLNEFFFQQVSGISI